MLSEAFGDSNSLDNEFYFGLVFNESFLVNLNFVSLDEGDWGLDREYEVSLLNNFEEFFLKEIGACYSKSINLVENEWMEFY